MKSIRIVIILIGVIGLLFTSCKSDFEKIRTSGDVDSIYKTAFEYYEQEEYLKAQSLFELVINNLRGKVEAEKVYYYYAYTHFHLKRYVLASYYFKNFSTTFPNSSYREEADFMTGFSNYQLSPTYRLDQSYSLKAIDQFQLFVNTYPTSEKVKQCNQLIDEMRRKLEQKAYAEGQLYFDLRQYQAATSSFENLLREFPDTPNAENVRYMMIRANYLLASNSIYTKQEERFKNTMKYYEIFVEKYPKSKFDKELVTIYKNSTQKLKELDNDRYQVKSARSRS